MEELRKEINEAYTLLAAIPVRGNAVEVMAEARRILRNAYNLTGKEAAEHGG